MRDVRSNGQRNRVSPAATRVGKKSQKVDMPKMRRKAHARRMITVHEPSFEIAWEWCHVFKGALLSFDKEVCNCFAHMCERIARA